jgi:outer membrane receptor protein involved in Fe transport
VFVCPGAFGYDSSFGNLPPVISSIRNPGQKTVDFSLTKKIPIYKEYNLEFRADAYNLFNWVEFAGPDAGPADVTFGLINGTTVEPRVLQVAAKFKF